MVIYSIVIVDKGIFAKAMSCITIFLGFNDFFSYEVFMSIVSLLLPSGSWKHALESYRTIDPEPMSARVPHPCIRAKIINHQPMTAATFQFTPDGRDM